LTNVIIEKLGKLVYKQNCSSYAPRRLPDYSCRKRNTLYPIRAASFVSILVYLIHIPQTVSSDSTCRSICLLIYILSYVNNFLKFLKLLAVLNLINIPVPDYSNPLPVGPAITLRVSYIIWYQPTVTLNNIDAYFKIAPFSITIYSFPNYMFVCYLIIIWYSHLMRQDKAI
jgi:hypothetical protein